MKFFLLLFLLATTCIDSSAVAEEVAANQRGGIRITLQVFTGKKTVLQPIARELMAPATNATAGAQLEKLSSAGTVELVSEVIGQTSANTEFTAFQGEVVRFPMQFDRPEMLTGRADPKAAAAMAAGGPAAFGFPASHYESKNVGTSLTLTASRNEIGDQIIASFDWKRSWMVQWDEFEVGRLPNNEKIIIKQPRFAEAGSSGGFGVASGERTLLGIHSVPGAADRAELVLVTLELNAANPK